MPERRVYKPEEKLKIVLEGMSGTISDTYVFPIGKRMPIDGCVPGKFIVKQI